MLARYYATGMSTFQKYAHDDKDERGDGRSTADELKQKIEEIFAQELSPMRV